MAPTATIYVPYVRASSSDPVAKVRKRNGQKCATSFYKKKKKEWEEEATLDKLEAMVSMTGFRFSELEHVVNFKKSKKIRRQMFDNCPITA